MPQFPTLDGRLTPLRPVTLESSGAGMTGRPWSGPVFVLSDSCCRMQVRTTHLGQLKRDASPFLRRTVAETATRKHIPYDLVVCPETCRLLDGGCPIVAPASGPGSYRVIDNAAPWQDGETLYPSVKEVQPSPHGDYADTLRRSSSWTLAKRKLVFQRRVQP